MSSDTFEYVFTETGVIVWRTSGISMRPLIRGESDLIVVEQINDDVNPFDVVLYRRINNNKTQYVLHRVIAVEDTFYRILGDNCVSIELVPKENILGTAKKLIRNGKNISFSGPAYKAYLFFWIKPYKMRIALLRFKNRAMSVMSVVIPDKIKDRIKDRIR